MANWDPEWGWPPASRPIRVESGIKARSRRGQIGGTWWSRRFLKTLEALELGGRLGRGRAYARAGQVLDLEVTPGLVTARVQGSRVSPYRVRVEATTLSRQDWARVEAAMASQAIFSAKLLAGEMPQEIEEAFAACSLTLFPASIRDLHTTCSCPDWSNPCKHLAAVLYLLAEAFDDDPFLMFAWRGRGRDELLEALRALRGATDAAAVDQQDEDLDAEVPALASSLDTFWRLGADPSALRVRPERAAMADLLLRQLDRPAVELRGRSLVELLAPAYEQLATAAERRAAGGGDGDGDGDDDGGGDGQRSG